MSAVFHVVAFISSGIETALSLHQAVYNLPVPPMVRLSQLLQLKFVDVEVKRGGVTETFAEALVKRLFT